MYNCRIWTVIYIFRQFMFCLVEEMKHPERIVPKATAITFCVVISVYLLTNVCYLVVLSPQEMMQADAVALVRSLH